MKSNLKNKVNEKTGGFICNRCGSDVGLAKIIKGYVYCLKCAEILRGIRDNNGKRREL